MEAGFLRYFFLNLLVAVELANLECVALNWNFRKEKKKKKVRLLCEAHQHLLVSPHYAVNKGRLMPHRYLPHKAQKLGAT